MLREILFWEKGNPLGFAERAEFGKTGITRLKACMKDWFNAYPGGWFSQGLFILKQDILRVRAASQVFPIVSVFRPKTPSQGTLCSYFTRQSETIETPKQQQWRKGRTAPMLKRTLWTPLWTPTLSHQRLD